MNEYEEFIKSKIQVFESVGFDINREQLNPMLFEFQKDIVRWALKKGRAAIFAGCGLGKTLMQLEWANQIHKKEGGKILILAPLSVASQTKREGEKFNIPVNICESHSDVTDGINITNYEKLDKFIAKEFNAIVLDESSILKSFTGKVRSQIIHSFKNTPYRLACTATPSPNSYMELGNHSQFLGVMTREEMLSMYFVHDGGNTSQWRLKHHAEEKFWEWMATWSVFINNPSDLGYQSEGYDLPELNIEEIIVDGNEIITDKLTLTQRREARKEKIDLKLPIIEELIEKDNGSWLIWCDYNYEQDQISKLLGDRCVSIQGSTPPAKKIEWEKQWRNGAVPIMVTKAKIFGYGLNWQHCHNVIFFGMSDSFEDYYQALRRTWRFGQEHKVNVYIIISSKEGTIKENIERKQVDAEKMQNAMIKLTKDITKKELRQTTRISTPYDPQIDIIVPDWLIEQI